ncbi:hypothetical protein [Nitrosopumilus sp. Nsub]|uniref:hypothetical protein n=1 Tax=Nitrosopumilus sp. Nsub TaxID=1776294 RepID=UPI000833BECC|nr:hypothetical protein [Nitrosopumilus sp. Nsub]
MAKVISKSVKKSKPTKKVTKSKTTKSKTKKTVKSKSSKKDELSKLLSQVDLLEKKIDELLAKNSA